MAKRTIIHLFRNDLRLHDNECLTWANKNADYVIPLYCFDPKHYGKSHCYGLPKTGKFRAQFLIECVENLRENLKLKGSNLVVRNKTPSEAVSELMEQCKDHAPVCSLVFQEETTQEEIDVEISLKGCCDKYDVQVKSFWGLTLYNKDDLPYKDCMVPDVYSAYRMKTENHSTVRNLIIESEIYKKLPSIKNGKLGDIPSLLELGLETFTGHPLSVFPFKGGETTGLKRLNDYLWGTDKVSTYKETRNELLGRDYSTKFSPWLANGSLSPRMIYHKLKSYEKDIIKNDSTYWVVFELMWRDYFKFISVKYGNKMFYPGGLKNKTIDWKYDNALFTKWCQGQTGVPFVDANMRELLHTGWMSNRGRQNVASFLVKDLQLDWRYGAEWFESLLLDHDVTSNYGNWNYAAGIGNDPRGAFRKFNMIKQGRDYDPTGEYLKTWIPELSKLPDDKAHAPWILLAPPTSYPKPVHIAPEWEKHYPKSTKRTAGKRKQGIDFYFKSGSASQ